MGCEVTSETCGDADRRSEKYEIEMVQSCAVSFPTTKRVANKRSK